MPSPLRPPKSLTRLQLLLRLAAGHGVEQIALLFGLVLAVLEPRAWKVIGEARGMRALCALPKDDRFNRLSRMAHLRLQAAMRAGVLGACEFFRWSWSRNEDPAQRIAALAEARLAGVGRVLAERPGLGPPPSRPGRGSPRLRLDHAAMRFALRLRDSVIAEEGQAVRFGWRGKPEDRPLDRRASHVPRPPWWVSDFSVVPQPEPLWAALRLPPGMPRPPPQGIPPHGNAVFVR